MCDFKTETMQRAGSRPDETLTMHMKITCTMKSYRNNNHFGIACFLEGIPILSILQNSSDEFHPL